MTGLPRLFFDRSLPDGLDDLLVGRVEMVGPHPRTSAVPPV